MIKDLLDATGQQGPTGDVGLRIIRGTVTEMGTYTPSNAGFSAIRTAEGRYTVTFTPAFSSTPVVTAQVVNNSSGYAFVVVTQTVNSCDVIVVNPQLTDNVDIVFNFIAIGTH